MNQTSHELWQAFYQIVDEPSPLNAFKSEEAILRFKCVQGLLALDLSLREFWQNVIAPEKEEFQTLLKEGSGNSELLHRWEAASESLLSSEEWANQFCILDNAMQTDNFRASFTESACLLALSQSDENRILQNHTWRSLFEIQNIKTLTSTSNAQFKKTDALKMLSLLKSFGQNANKLHPLFQAINGKSPNTGLRTAA